MSGVQAPGRPVLALTGGTGFIGAALLPQLVAAGWRVRALYRPRHGRELPDGADVHWIPGDLGDDAALDALVAGAEVVVHCAGAVRGARRADFDRVNEDGTRRLVRAAARAAACRRFLLLSSLAAREPRLSDYAGSKRRGEIALADNGGRLRWSVLRPAAVYGPGDREMLPLFRNMARGIALTPGRARGRFSLLYIDDLAAAMLRWLVTDAGHGDTFELDDGRDGGYDWDTVARIASRALRHGARVRRVAIPMPLLRSAAWVNVSLARWSGRAPMLTPGKVRELTHADWVCDSEAFARCTGWRAAFGLERGLVSTFSSPASLLHGVS